MNHDDEAARLRWARCIVLRQHAQACCLTRLAGNCSQYRISPRPLSFVGEVPSGGFLSSWCSTEERAWQAAISRQSSRDNNKDHW